MGLGSGKFEAQVQSIHNNVSNSETSMSSLPSWLKNESIRLRNNDQVTIHTFCLSDMGG